MSTHAIGPLSSGTWPYRVTPVASSHTGAQRLQTADDHILSVQPDGRVELRPADADGPYEWCVITGSAVAYAPDVASPVYAFGLLPIPQ